MSQDNDTPAQGQNPGNPPEVDSPEYLQQMMDRAGNSRAEDLNEQDSSLILGKFQDVDALAEAYKQLESKMGQKSSGGDTADPNQLGIDFDQQDEGGDTNDEGAAKDLSLKRPTKDDVGESDDSDSTDSGEVFEEFGRKYAEQGGFTDEDYQALSDKGFPKEVVSVYEAGLKSLVEARSNAASSAVGGTENLQQIQSWAGQSLSDAELNAFNQQLSAAQTPEAVGVIYEALAVRFRAAGGESSLVKGNSGGARSAGFANRSEMVAAMSDPRYGKDDAYTREVELKTSNASFL